MSMAVTSAAAAPLSSPHTTRDPSPKNCPTLPPPSSAPANSSSPPRMSSAQEGPAQGSPGNKDPSSPPLPAPKITVKKEPASSPRIQTRPRPRKLDLSTSLPSSSGLQVRPPGGPMTAREGVNMQEVGLACLSPGFQTHDPVMREQLQRSLSVRDQQRLIIESRLQRSAKDEGPDGVRPSESGFMAMPRTGSKRKPPPGLSIVPPSASHFANERVIQSAPLNQTFTSRYQPPPLTRQAVNQSPTLGSSTHMHQLPATQTNNRLPPLSDVFGSDALAPRDREPSRSGLHPNASSTNSSQSTLAPMPSPGLPPAPPGMSQTPGRPREYRSAEEAVQELSGGREDLLPRIVHYGGHQPPTPPSPQAFHMAPKTAPLASEFPIPPPPAPLLPFDSTSRRRPRSEYEHDNGSPPLGHGPDTQYRPNPAMNAGPSLSLPGLPGPFGAGRDSPETQRKKKDEFLGLCARAWDLFHS